MQHAIRVRLKTRVILAIRARPKTRAIPAIRVQLKTRAILATLAPPKKLVTRATHAILALLKTRATRATLVRPRQLLTSRAKSCNFFCGNRWVPVSDLASAAKKESKLHTLKMAVPACRGLPCGLVRWPAG